MNVEERAKSDVEERESRKKMMCVALQLFSPFNMLSLAACPWRA
jgi:hypothetical protein